MCMKYFCWKNLGLTLLHNHIASDNDLVENFSDKFGTYLDNVRLNEAFLCGYYFYSPTHNVTIKSIADLKELGIEVF